MAFMSRNPTARLIEVFSAIQGEGLNVGTRQIFIRFAVCDLRCWFCDSESTWHVPPTCQIERSPGSRDFEPHTNPVEIADLLAWVDRQDQPNLHDSISLTGGEPLLHDRFLAAFLPQLRYQSALPIYLETGGHRPERLPALLPHLDSIGMDLKLPSVSGETHWEAHAQFLRQCRQAGKTVFVKLIVSATTNPAELGQAAQLIATIDPTIPCFLQPVTPLEQPHAGRDRTHLPHPPDPAAVLGWQAQLKTLLTDVRVVPQTHKMIGQR